MAKLELPIPPKFPAWNENIHLGFWNEGELTEVGRVSLSNWDPGMDIIQFNQGRLHPFIRLSDIVPSEQEEAELSPDIAVDERGTLFWGPKMVFRTGPTTFVVTTWGLT